MYFENVSDRNLVEEQQLFLPNVSLELWKKVLKVIVPVSCDDTSDVDIIK